MSAVDDQTKRATRQERAGMHDRWLLEWIADTQEDIMAAIDELRTAVQSMQDSADAEHTELQSVAAEIGTLEQQITDLQGKVTSGGTVSEADIADVTAKVTAIAKTAQDAVAAAKTATAPATPGGTPAPVDPTVPAPVTPAPGTPAPTGTPADPTAGTPTAGTPVDPTTTAPTGVATADRAVYYFDGDPVTVDPTTWPIAPLKVPADGSPAGAQLYFFAGDTQPGEVAGDGVGGVWHHYTGPTEPTVVAGAEAQQADGGVEPISGEQ